MSKMRWDCIANVLKNKEHKIGAEIGVWKGIFTFEILKLLPDIEKYYCIDSWKMYPDYKKAVKGKAHLEANYDNIFKIYKNQVKQFNNKITTLRMMSKEAADHIPDGYLDWVFIDANHSYKYVKEDIMTWNPKVKVGGLLSGHDYGRNQHSDIEVTKAVDELVPNVNKGDNGVWYIFKEIGNG